jgi:expansin (peptidoglycan-binding protein)
VGPARLAGAEVVPGDGIATSYDSVDGGNCSLPGPPTDHLDVALSHVEYGTADACGGYLDVTGPGGTIRVLITNQCPECPVGHIDLSRTAFARLAPLEVGEIPVSYTLVRDPPVAQPIAVRVKTGSSRWWLQIQAIDHGNPIAGFALLTADGWRSLVHTDDNFWMAENPGPGDGPFSVRITDIYGQTATADGIELAPDVVQRTGVRLYPAGAGGAPSPVPAATGPPAETTTAPLPPPTKPPAAPTTSAVPAPAGELAVAPARSGGGSGGGTGPAVAVVAAIVALAATGAVLLRRRRDGTPS